MSDKNLGYTKNEQSFGDLLKEIDKMDKNKGNKPKVTADVKDEMDNGVGETDVE